MCFMRGLWKEIFFGLNRLGIYLSLNLYVEIEMICVLDSDVEDLGNE